MVSFQGHTLFSEPNMKPVNTANVILRKCFNAYERIREKEVIPIKAPTKTLIKPLYQVF